MTRPVELADFALAPEVGDDGVVGLSMGEIARGFYTLAGEDRVLAAGELNYMFNRVGHWIRFLAGEAPLRIWYDGPAGTFDNAAGDACEVRANIITGSRVIRIAYVTTAGLTVDGSFISSTGIGGASMTDPTLCDWDGVAGSIWEGSPTLLMVGSATTARVAFVSYDPIVGLSYVNAGVLLSGTGLLVGLRWVGGSWVAVMEGQLHRSTDGLTWGPVADTLAGDRIVIDTDRAGHAVVLSDGGDIAYSSDDGATWGVVNLPAGAESSYGVAMSANGTAVAYGSTGVSISSDFGQTWSAFEAFPNAGLSGVNIYEVQGAWVASTASGQWTATEPTGAPGAVDSGWTPNQSHVGHYVDNKMRRVGRRLFSARTGKMTGEVHIP